MYEHLHIKPTARPSLCAYSMRELTVQQDAELMLQTPRDWLAASNEQLAPAQLVLIHIGFQPALPSQRSRAQS